jgi:hypothetical protein
MLSSVGAIRGITEDIRGRAVQDELARLWLRSVKNGGPLQLKIRRASEAVTHCVRITVFAWDLGPDSMFTTSAKSTLAFCASCLRSIFDLPPRGICPDSKGRRLSDQPL